MLQLLDHLRMNLKRQGTVLINFTKLKNSLVHSIFLWTKRKWIFSADHSTGRSLFYKIYAMFCDKNLKHLIFTKMACNTVLPLFVIILHHNLLGTVSKRIKTKDR